MKGCSTAFFMWLPILIGKLLKGIWLLIKWILQTISGVPLHFCKPEYRIPAQIFGVVGLAFSGLFIFGVLIILLDPLYLKQQGHSLLNYISSIIVVGVLGLLLLLVCRALIKKGSI